MLVMTSISDNPLEFRNGLLDIGMTLRERSFRHTPGEPCATAYGNREATRMPSFPAAVPLVDRKKDPGSTPSYLIDVELDSKIGLF
jgi:hypothetical protein